MNSSLIGTMALYLMILTVMAEPEDGDKYDILIIGAGITGLSHSHLLSTETDNNYKTLTVERFNRVCGRTHSSELEHDGKSIIFEHGSMRFYYHEEHQKMLYRMGLCDNLVPFEHTFFSDIRNSSNFYFRNELQRGSRGLTEFFMDIYNINEEEEDWMDDPDLPRSIGYIEILEENADKLRDDFWEKWTLRGTLVKNWDEYTFWKIVLNPSIEYFNFQNRNGRIINDRGVGMEFLKWIKDHEQILAAYPSPGSAEDTFPGFEMTVDDLHNEGGIFFDQYIRNETATHFTLDIGYDTICKRLYDNASSYDFNDFLFGYKVIKIIKMDFGEYPYLVTLQNVGRPNEIKHVFSSKIISTIAPEHLSHLLKNIDFGRRFSPKYNDYIQSNLLDAVIQDESFKISLIYDDEWWQQNNLTDFAGHLLTDINIQTFLMEESWTNDTLTVVHFYVWGPEQSHLFHRLQQMGSQYLPDRNVQVNNEETLLLSSDVLVHEVMRQLHELTEIDDIPLPLAAYSSPLGFNFSSNAGVFRWKAGYDIQYVLDHIIKPIEEEDFYITTSSISPYQAWMYGGIWATLQNLEQNFGVVDPLKNEKTCIADPNKFI